MVAVLVYVYKDAAGAGSAAGSKRWPSRCERVFMSGGVISYSKTSVAGDSGTRRWRRWRQGGGGGEGGGMAAAGMAHGMVVEV